MPLMAILIKDIQSFVPRCIAEIMIEDPQYLTGVGERNYPSVMLFADIAGFTRLTEELTLQDNEGVETLTRVLNSYFGTMIDRIVAHGGDVFRFAGDALLAIWIEGEINDLCQLATRCSLELQTAVEKMKAEHQMPLSVRMDLGTGEVLLSNVGGIYKRWEFLLRGLPFSQLEQTNHYAKPGEVVLSPEMVKIAEGYLNGSLAFQKNQTITNFQKKVKLFSF